MGDERRSLRDWLGLLGPGVAIAATGVGAGDIVAAAKAGATHGYALVWAALAGAALKYVLNEGIARWQLATGTTLLEGWTERLGRWASWFFLVYLVFWSYLVAAALVNACGIAAHAVAPGLSVRAWGVIHSVAAALFVIVGRYETFERLMKGFIAVMFVALIGCALLVQSPAVSLAASVGEAGIPALPIVLSVMGGVGGSVTVLAYGYWIRERGWRGPAWLPVVRVDLAVAYALTGLFGVALMVVAAALLQPAGIEVSGAGSAVKLADMIAGVLGPAGRWIFLLGFWGAVTTSMLGVWQGDPYLFCDFVGLVRRLPEATHQALIDRRSKLYRGYLLYLAVPPLALLWLDKPVAVITAYTIVGALFMPFLAVTLLLMNSRRAWVGELRSGWGTNLALLACLLLFAVLAVMAVAGDASAAG